MNILPRKILMALAMAFLFPATVLAGDIVIDPGHSPNSPGATSCSGASEVKYNDSLAESVASLLKSKNIDVELTRTPAQNMGLFERVKNTGGKKLFISLHHDSVQPQFIQKVNNLPVSGKGEGFSIFLSRKNPYFNESLGYAKKLGDQLLKAGLRPSVHHAEMVKGEGREAVDAKRGIYIYDDLIVLKHSKCPALLLEGGVLVNPRDERLVKTDAFKSKVSKAIYSAITRGGIRQHAQKL